MKLSGGWPASGHFQLRALLYMDEIFGLFPSHSHASIQIAHARFVETGSSIWRGVILATQNPVDLDYKGLSNCGTWFIGKLQTERDKSRVLEGLSDTSKGESSQALKKMLESVKSRVFVVRSIYEEAPFLFETRWTLPTCVDHLHCPKSTH